MVEIKHRVTGQVLHRVEAETLRGAKLSGANLAGADLTDADLLYADLTGTLGIALRECAPVD